MGSTGARRPESAAPSAYRGHSLRPAGLREERRARLVPDFARSVAPPAPRSPRRPPRTRSPRRGPPRPRTRSVGPPGRIKGCRSSNAAGRDATSTSAAPVASRSTPHAVRTHACGGARNSKDTNFAFAESASATACFHRRGSITTISRRELVRGARIPPARIAGGAMRTGRTSPLRWARGAEAPRGSIERNIVRQRPSRDA